MLFALGYAVIMPATLEGASTAPTRKTENSEEYNCVTAVMPFAQIRSSCDPEGASDVLADSALPNPL